MKKKSKQLDTNTKQKKARIKRNGKVAKFNPRSLNYEEMSYKDIKKHAIMMGMSPEDVVNGDFNRLHSFLMKAEGEPNKELLEEFDFWVKRHLSKEQRKLQKRHPVLTMAYVSERVSKEESDKPQKRVRSKKEKKESKPVEKNSDGFVKGTKKEYTINLAKKGFEVDHVIKRVLKKFPDANQKSIAIWYKRAKKLM